MKLLEAKLSTSCNLQDYQSSLGSLFQSHVLLLPSGKRNTHCAGCPEHSLAALVVKARKKLVSMRQQTLIQDKKETIRYYSLRLFIIPIETSLVISRYTSRRGDSVLSITSNVYQEDDQSNHDIRCEEHSFIRGYELACTCNLSHLFLLDIMDPFQKLALVSALFHYPRSMRSLRYKGDSAICSCCSFRLKCANRLHINEIAEVREERPDSCAGTGFLVC